MSEQEVLAYIAGIVDGEGSIIITKAQRKENRAGCRFIPMLVITNTHKGVLDFIVEKTGYGKVQPRNEKTMERFGWKSNKLAWRWDVKHQQVGEVVKKLLPYLIIKKHQAENLLEFLNLFEEIPSNYFEQEDLDLQFKYFIRSKELNGKTLTEEEKEKLRPVLRAYVNERGKCSIEGCQELHYGKGLCRTHWKRKYYAEILKEKKPWRKDSEDQPLELVS